jgi:uncharacterized protein DUF4058
MKSPFPGMDPYIETCGLWEDFHFLFIGSIYRAIAPVLPRGYTIETATRAYIVLMEAEGKKSHLMKPDVTVTEPLGRKKPRRKNGGVAIATPPTAVQSVPMRAFLAEKIKENFIEIYAEGEDRVLVTCIEVLSPTNKRPKTEGWTEYLRKRQALLLGQANLIEIDLLRGGRKLPMVDRWPDCPYTLLVSRQVDAPNCRVWPASFQQRLPAIPVPLADPDPDLSLDLQPLIDGIYELGRYDERIDYARPLNPALSAADAAWVRKQLQNRPGRK